jgi:hypothetical protein
VAVYNILGEQVALLNRGMIAAGRYRLHWSAEAQPSGTYFAVLKAPSATKVRKLLLLK